MDNMVWLILAFVIMAVLPDLLRRRRYPRRKGPIPVPPRRKPAPEPAKPDAAAAEAEAAPAPQQAPVPKPVPSPKQPAPAAPLPHVPQGRVPLEAAAAVRVPQRVRPVGWSQLPPQARDIYAGIVWSEILQEPLAYRRGYIKNSREDL